MCTDGPVIHSLYWLLHCQESMRVWPSPWQEKSLKVSICAHMRVRVCVSLWISTHLPSFQPWQRRALLPSSALCTSPRDGYSNFNQLFPLTPLWEHFSHRCFPPLPSRSVTPTLIVRGPFLYFISVWQLLHLQSNHISFHSKVTGYYLASRFLLYSCINLAKVPSTFRMTEESCMLFMKGVKGDRDKERKVTYKLPKRKNRGSERSISSSFWDGKLAPTVKMCTPIAKFTQ